MIRNKKIVLFLSLIVLSAYPLYSNGGPIDGSTLISSGNIQLKKIDSVDLVYERLFIRPVNDYVDVHIIYELNCKDDNKTVEYGFPFYNYPYRSVDYISFDDSNNDYIKFFKLRLNGKLIKLREKIDKNVSYEYGDDYDGVRSRNGENKWYLAQLVLTKGKNTIDIQYSVKSCFNDNYDTGELTKFFKYNFKPAASWGKGVVDKLEIFIDIFALRMKEAEYTIGGIKDFQKKDDIYHIIIEKTNFSRLSDLKIDYNIEKYYNNYQLPGKTSTLVKNITASSSLKGNYSPINLIDNNRETAWVEGVAGYGINEWVEVEFNERASVRNIGIANGFMRTWELFHKNSKVKTIQFDIQGLKKGPTKTYFTLSKTINLPELKDNQLQYLYDWDGLNKKYINILIGPEDFDTDYEITKIRLIIKDVYPGIKFEDTCITELFAF